MPSLLSTIVLFLTVSSCSARCTYSRAKSTAQSPSTVSSVLTSTYLAASPTEPPTVSSAVVSGSSPTSTQGGASNNLLENFKPGAKWQIAIQDPVDPRGGLQPADAQVVDVDLFLASKDPTLIPTLHVSYDCAVGLSCGNSDRVLHSLLELLFYVIS